MHRVAQGGRSQVGLSSESTMPSARGLRRISRFVLAIVAAVGFLVLPAQPAPASSCSALLVVGVRGSGEAYEAKTAGMGPEVFAAYSQIAPRVHGTQPYGLPYPAVPVLPLSQLGSAYWQSLSYGDHMLYQYVSQEVTACPYQRIALIGYSQGAHVIGDTLKNLTAGQRALIAQILLFGDPRFNPAISGIDRGDYNPSLQGVFGARTIASLWYSKMRDYCALHDPVCNYSTANIAGCISRCAHYQYVTSGKAAFAGALAGNAIAALPSLGPSSPNTRDFRCFGLSGVERLSCSVRVLESVFVVASPACGHGRNPRVAAGPARGSTVRGPGAGAGAVPPS